MHWQIKSFSATCANGKVSINKGKRKLLQINFKPASGTWCSVYDFTSLSTSCDPMSFSCLLSLHQSFQLWMNKTIQPNLVSRTFGENRVQGPWLLSTITGDWAATWGHFNPRCPSGKNVPGNLAYTLIMLHSREDLSKWSDGEDHIAGEGLGIA